MQGGGEGGRGAWVFRGFQEEDERRVVGHLSSGESTVWPGDRVGPWNTHPPTLTPLYLIAIFVRAFINTKFYPAP